MSVKSHLTYGASVRPENAVTYSAGNEGKKICGVFSETAPLQRSSTPSVVRPCVQSAIFPAACVSVPHAYLYCMRISRVYTRMIHRRGFSTLVLFIGSVSLSVCVSVKSHLTYGASVRPENAVTYSAGNEGQKICGVFSETAPLQRSSTPSVVRPCVQSAIFPCVFLVYAHAYFSCIYAHDTPPRVQHFSAFHCYCYQFPLKSYV